MTKEDNDNINWIRSKSRFINSDFERLKSTYNKLIGKSVNWSCPSCVRTAINELITYQHKNKNEDKDF
jgi:hypothetical protein